MLKLDKIVLTNLEVLEIKGDTQADITFGRYVATDSAGTEYTSIKLANCKYFDMFSANVNSLGKYSKISLKSSAIDYLLGIDVDNITNLVKQAKTELEENGLIVDFANAKIKSIELQNTFEIKRDYAEYKDMFELLIINLLCDIEKEKRIQKIGTSKDFNAEYNTFYNSSKQNNKDKNYTDAKIYNKTEQLLQEKNIELDTNYVRLEFKLCGDREIKKELGITYLSELTNNVVKKYWKNVVIKALINLKLYAGKITFMQQKIICDAYEKYNTSGRKTNYYFIKDFIKDIKSENIDTLLFVEDICYVFKDKYKFDKHKMFDLRQKIIEECIKNNIFVIVKNKEKLKEIYNKSVIPELYKNIL